MNKKNITNIFVLLLLTAFVSCNAQESKKVSTQAVTAKEKTAAPALAYKIREAQGAESPVLVVLMHGYGANEDDLISLANEFPSNYTVVSPQAPYQIGATNYQWYTNQRSRDNSIEGGVSELKNSTEKMLTLIQSLQTKYKVASDRTFLGGFSQGANMSYQIALNNPKLVKGIIVMSGAMFGTLKTEKDKVKADGFHVFIGHGDADNRVPYSEAVNAEKWLKERGFHPEFHTYKGMTHSISPDEVKDIVGFIQKNTSK